MKRQSGFTLIELLIVVAIVGIIAAIAVPILLHARTSAREAAIIGTLRAINRAHAQSKAEAPTLPQLATEELLDTSFQTTPYVVHAYWIADVGAKSCSAQPLDADASARFYLLTADGAIHVRLGAAASSSDPSIGSESE